MLLDWIGTTEVLLTSTSPLERLAADELRASAAEATMFGPMNDAPLRSPRALSGMVLLFVAFEAWVNRELTRLLFMRQRELSDGEKKKLQRLVLKDDVARKAGHLPEWAGGTRLADERLRDLRLAVESVRHELVHELPASNRIAQPDRVRQLAARGLLLSSGAADVELMLPERLQSYDLLFWCWQTVGFVVTAIEDQSAPNRLTPMAGLTWTAGRQVRTPEALRNDLPAS